MMQTFCFKGNWCENFSTAGCKGEKSLQFSVARRITVAGVLRNPRLHYSIKIMTESSTQTPPQEDQLARSLLALCVHASLADGAKSEEEREEIRRIGRSLSAEGAGPVIQEVLLGRLSLETAVAGLQDPHQKLLAYEMALGVCEADDFLQDSEKVFLEKLRGLLALPEADRKDVETKVGEVALAPLPVALPAAAAASIPAAVQKADNSSMILKYAILNGALELLPETLATIAIVPMQVKMVYRIGVTHGVALDKNHIKEFIATIGAGMASQMVEGFARKLAAGFFRKTMGKMAGKVANQATGSLVSFASTYAIGMVADRYYSGGRSLSAQSLKSEFADFSSRAKGMYETYRPQIEEKSKTLNPASIFSMIKGGDPAL